MKSISLIDLGASTTRPLERFLAEALPDAATSTVGGDERPQDAEEIVLRLALLIARIDRILNDQINLIIHHPDFQRVEAAWRGLSFLCQDAAEAEGVKIRILDATWRELVRDAERAMDFDQSQLFRLVYTQEFDTPGGEPFAVLLGNYFVRHRPGADHPTDDVGALRAISGVAAAAFSPLILGVEPQFFGLEDFAALERPIDLQRVFQDQIEYQKWRDLREQHDSRFVGLVLPRMLLREPHGDYCGRQDGFRFEERTEDVGDYLWGNAVFAFGTVLIRAFSDYGWMGSIRGVERDLDTGGIVSGFASAHSDTDPRALQPKPLTEVVITDAQERVLSDLGFISLCQCHGTEFGAFYSIPSIQRAKKYDDAGATINAKISSMLHYMLCVARFAHYLKLIGRDAIGSFTTAIECERHLNKWIQRYTTSNEDVSLEIQARYPLREARVQVSEVPGRPGTFSSTIHLRPYFQLDRLTTAVTLVTELYREER